MLGEEMQTQESKVAGFLLSLFLTFSKEYHHTSRSGARKQR